MLFSFACIYAPHIICVLHTHTCSYSLSHNKSTKKKNIYQCTQALNVMASSSASCFGGWQWGRWQHRDTQFREMQGCTASFFVSMIHRTKASICVRTYLMPEVWEKAKSHRLTSDSMVLVLYHFKWKNWNGKGESRLELDHHTHRERKRETNTFIRTYYAHREILPSFYVTWTITTERCE